MTVKSNADTIAAKLQWYAKATPDAVDEELFKWCEYILVESKKEVPFDTGNLRDSGVVEPPSPDGSLGYAVGYTAVYAHYQHEAGGGVTDFNHPRGGKWHFLSDPLERILPMIVPGIVKKIDRLYSA